jgi:hypothetical protein
MKAKGYVWLQFCKAKTFIILYQHDLTSSSSVSFQSVIEFISNSEPRECDFVTVLWIVAFHGIQLFGYFLQNFLQHFFHEVRCTKVMYINDFCSTPFYIFEHYPSQHCILYLYKTQGQLTTLNQQCLQDKVANTRKLSNGSAMSSGQVQVNKFLAGQPKDKLDSMYKVQPDFRLHFLGKKS